MISRAAKGSKDSQVSQALDWAVYFSQATWGGHFTRGHLISTCARLASSMSDGAENCTVMIEDPLPKIKKTTFFWLAELKGIGRPRL